MAIIKTLDNFDTATESAPTAANFPSLKHFLDAEDISTGVSQSWVCQISGSSVTASAVSAGDTSYDKAITISVDTAFTGGYSAPATGPCLVFCMGVADTNDHWIFGSSLASDTTDAIRVKMGVGAALISDFSAGPLTDAADDYTSHATNPQMFCIAFDIAGNTINSYQYDGSTLTTNSANATTNCSSISPGAFMACSTVTTYAIAMLHPTVLPPDSVIASATAWMFDNWLSGGGGNGKTIYPGFRDIT